MASADSSSRITSGISGLSLKPTALAGNKGDKSRTTKKAAPVADSWEDEDEDEQATSDSDTEPDTGRGRGTDNGNAGTQAPPPTPMSPTYNTSGIRSLSPAGVTSPTYLPGIDEDSASSSGSPKRPEKTDAVARRMIAGALGMRVPKLSEEQRAYDKAVREKERKRREEEQEKERRRQIEAEKAKQSAWED